MEFRQILISSALVAALCIILAVGVNGNKNEFVDPVLNHEGKCIKAKLLSDGCRTCSCQEGGFLHCTDNNCAPEVEVPDAESENGQDQRKEPIMTLEGKCLKATSLSDGCNTCACQEGGALLCTDYQCLLKEKTHDVLEESVYEEKEKSMESYLNHKGRCIKEGSFFDGCSRCVCRKGHKPHCNYKKCLYKRETGKISPGGRCKPGDKWKLDECNNCVCTHTGYASCTLNECSPKRKGKRSTQNSKVDKNGKCKPGDRWQLDECNNCVCTHTGYASCTLNDCKSNKRGKRTASIGKPLDMKKREAKPWRVQGNSGNECRAGHSWKENCNSCFCSERGIAMCTDMACPTPTPRPKK